MRSQKWVILIRFSQQFVFLSTFQVWSAVAAPRPFSVDVTSFDEFVSQAQVKVQSASYRLKEMLNLPKDTKALAVFEAIKNNTENFTKEVSDVVSKIRKQVSKVEDEVTLSSVVITH